MELALPFIGARLKFVVKAAGGGAWQSIHHCAIGLLVQIMLLQNLAWIGQAVCPIEEPVST